MPTNPGVGKPFALPIFVSIPLSIDRRVAPALMEFAVRHLRDHNPPILPRFCAPVTPRLACNGWCKPDPNVNAPTVVGVSFVPYALSHGQLVCGRATTEDELWSDFDECVSFFFLLLNSGCSISNMCAIFCRSALEEFPLSLQDAQSHIVPVCLPPGEKPAKGLHGRIIKVCGLMKTH